MVSSINLSQKYESPWRLFYINEPNFLLLMANTVCKRIQSQEPIHLLVLSRLHKNRKKLGPSTFTRLPNLPSLAAPTSLQPVPLPMVAPVHVAWGLHRGCWSSAFPGSPQRSQSNTRLYELHHSPAKRPDSGCGKGMSGSAFRSNMCYGRSTQQMETGHPMRLLGILVSD